MAKFIKKEASKKWGVLVLASSDYFFDIRLVYNGVTITSGFHDAKNRERMEEVFDFCLDKLREEHGSYFTHKSDVVDAEGNAVKS